MPAPTESAEPVAEPAQPSPPAEPSPPPEPEPVYDFGRFVWFEHWSKDAKAAEKAKAFYTDVFGWTIKQQQMGETKYDEIHVGETPVGMFSNPPDHKANASWMGYVSVPDVDAAVAAAGENGGALVGEAMEIPDLGKFAHLKSPSGAILGVFKGVKGDMPEAKPEPGKWAWMEAWVKNPKGKEAEVKFLTAATGWTTSDMPMGKNKYTALMSGGEKARGGIDVAPKAKEAGSWVPYVMVADVDAAVKKATAAKAKVIVKPKTIDEVGRVAVVVDPSGAKIGMWAELPAAEAEGAQAEGAGTKSKQ
jgi:predicted enzyme related to lactoylglutathione lyase